MGNVCLDESEFFLIDDIHANLDNSEKYYKNFLNDSYFNSSENNENKSNIENISNEKFMENSEEEVIE